MGKATSRENTKNSCVVCKEEKKQGIWCNGCTSTLVCQDCILSMCEHGICDKCPVCRKLDWKKSKFKKNQIIPLKTSNIRVNVVDRISRLNQDNEIAIKTRNCCHRVGGGINNVFCKTTSEKIYFWHCILRHGKFSENASFVCVTIPALIYAMGVILILIFMPDINWQKDLSFVWLPFIFGLSFTIILMWTTFKCCGVYYGCRNTL